MGRHRRTEFRAQADEELLREVWDIAADLGAEDHLSFSVMLTPGVRPGLWEIGLIALRTGEELEAPAVCSYQRVWPRSEPESLASALLGAASQLYFLVPRSEPSATAQGGEPRA